MSDNDKFQAIPTLVIGLGGTGLKVATHIKKSLLEANQNELPNKLAFLVFDTEDEIKYQAGGWGEERGINHATGPVKIDHGEYVGLTGSVYDLGKIIEQEQIDAASNPSIRRGQPHRHISNWFPAGHYFDEVKLKQPAWNLDVGAGRYRHLGRLGLFNRIMMVRDMLKSSMQAIKQMGSDKLYVHITGSLAGGTGAALFIDMAHLVRLIADEINLTQSPVIFGHFVLADGFLGTPQVNLDQPGVKSDFETRCYAALRELTRLQGNTEDYRIVYDPVGSDEMRGVLKSSLYSSVYLYDGIRQLNSLNTTTIENGLAPAIADAVVAYIDDLSGGYFCSHSVNYEAFHEALNVPKGKVTYGSIGTYTIELPIYHITEGWSHELAREALDILLLPAERDTNTQVPTVLVTNQPGGKSVDPKKEARKWFGEEATTMIGRLAEWGEQSGKGETLRREALTSILATDATVWQQQLAPSDPRFQNRINDAQSELEGSLEDETSHKYYVNHKAAGNSDAQKADNLQIEVDAKLQQMIGRSDGWRREGGDFRKALVRLGNHHVSEFEKSLTNWLNAHLNGGQVGNEVERKGGKIGFVTVFLSNLEDVLASSVGVLREADSLSNAKRRPLYNVIEDDRKDAATAMRNNSGWFDKNLKEYRDKSDELAQFHKADIARQVAHDLIIRVHKSVKQLLSEIKLWEKALARATSTQGGAYALVVEGQMEVASDRGKSQNQVRWVIGDHEPDDVYIAEKHHKYADGQLEAILSQMRWHVGKLDGDSDLRIDFTLGGQRWNRRAGQSGKQKKGQKRAGQKNSHQLLDACRSAFAPAWDDMSVVAYLKQNFLSNGDNIKELANKVHDNSGYLLSRTKPNTRPPMSSTFVRVRLEGLVQDDFVFLRRLRQEVATLSKETSTAKNTATAKGQDWSEIGHNSRDPFKLTFVLFGDLLQPEQIAGFVSAQEAYYKATGAGSQWEELQVLPDERNALSIEKNIDTGNDDVRQRRRDFDNKVVSVLKDMDRFQLATRCFAYGETDYYWGIGIHTGLLLHRYTPPRKNNPSRYSYWRLTVAPEDNSSGSGVRLQSTPEHYQLSGISEDPKLLDAFIQLVVVGKARGKNGKEIKWNRIEKTIRDAYDRHLTVWRERDDMGWMADATRFKEEGEEMSTQMIRLNALIAESDTFLQNHRWAWHTDGELAPEELREDKAQLKLLQREVDLYTAIRGAAVQENKNISKRLNDLGTWVKYTPNEKVVLSPDPPKDFDLSEEAAVDGWNCPECQTHNDDADNFCSNCRTKRPEPVIEKEIEAETEIVIGLETVIDSVLCENGHPMQEGWKLCPECGKGPKQDVDLLVCENGHLMQEGWKLCPECGKGPKQDVDLLVCENGHPMQEGWKLCPECGKGPKQDVDLLVCENGHPMQEGWKMCPECGATAV